MIKISPVNFKNLYNIGSKNIINNPISKNYNISFGQYDYFKKRIDDSNESLTDSNKYTYLESEKNQTSTPYYPLSDVNAVEPIDDIKDTLGSAAIAGGIFLLCIAVTDTIAKAMPSNDDNLYTQDGYYIGNVDDFKLQPSDIKVDLKDGTLKIDGTGVNLDKSRYDADLSNPEKGIFKSADGKLDIDLANNKYIDKENGIIVDPEKHISAFTTSDGNLHNIPIQNFGSGYPTRPEDSRWQDYHPVEDTPLNQEIQEYLKEHYISELASKNIIQYADDIRLKEYMLDNFPDLADKVNIGSIDKFIENIHEQGVNYNDANGLIDIINNDIPNPEII